MGDFSDLGKATRRGIKKCIKCGIYNGTKSIACKNKECDMIFKDFTDERRRIISDAVQLLTGNLRRLYSVRLKEQGSDYRGFVQLPIIQTLNVDETHTQFSEAALCFVDNCPRFFRDKILQCHENYNNRNSTNLCPHINASMKSCVAATPLPIKPYIISRLKAPKEFRKELLSLINDNHIPIIQKVSRNGMVVKCQVTPKHPLGFLHFTFKPGRTKKVCFTHLCSCTEAPSTTKCIHFYLCICALASNQKYSNDFSSIIKPEFLDGDIDANIETKQQYIPQTKKVLYLQHRQRRGKSKRESDTAAKKLRIERKIWPKLYPIHINILNPNDFRHNMPNTERQNPSWMFENWLTYIVESMNALMVFENSGVLNILKFDLPWDFYRVLRNRIPLEYLGSKDSCQEYEIFNIMNISHVKQIFGSSTVKLKVSKRFILSDDSTTYAEVNEEDELAGSLMPHFIYFLNVGPLTVDDSDNTNNSFMMEWMLNSRRTLVGQLKLQYKYGRKRL